MLSRDFYGIPSQFQSATCFVAPLHSDDATKLISDGIGTPVRSMSRLIPFRHLRLKSLSWNDRREVHRKGMTAARTGRDWCGGK
jgi:hypothetical protein